MFPPATPRGRGDIYRSTVFCIALLSAGCTAPEIAPAAPAARADYVACTAPRPEICTREYRPVCAQVDTGKRCVTTPCDSSVNETRGNACSACGDPKVMGYRQGACTDAMPR